MIMQRTQRPIVAVLPHICDAIDRMHFGKPSRHADVGSRKVITFAEQLQAQPARQSVREAVRKIESSRVMSAFVMPLTALTLGIATWRHPRAGCSDEAP